jgi:hypothetical protein
MAGLPVICWLIPDLEIIEVANLSRVPEVTA